MGTLKKKSKKEVVGKTKPVVSKTKPIIAKAAYKGPYFSLIARRLEATAEEHGIGPEHVARNADMLEELGIDPDDMTTDVVREAAELHRYKLHNLARRYGGTYVG